ncbi:MAG: AgmX/PglI C-terminal domain-containing protein [Polyangiaceae bacterium]
MSPSVDSGTSVFRAPGAITLAMRAARLEAPVRLRVAWVREGKVLEERLLPRGRGLSVGSADRADFRLELPDGPQLARLFFWSGGALVLELPAGAVFRGELGAGHIELGVAAGERAARARRFDVGPNARGVVSFGSERVLFQWVHAPLAQRAQLPLAVFRRTAYSDFAGVLILALSFLAHFTLVGALYSDWADPVLDEMVTVSGVLSELPLPAAPAESAAPSDDRSEVATTPKADTPRTPERSHDGPGQPARAQRSDAALSQRLDVLELATLGALGARGAATEGVLKRGEVPTSALDAAAARESGVSSGGLGFAPARGAPILPGQSSDLAALASRGSAVDLHDAGKARPTAGPRADAAVAPPNVSGSAVDGAAGVVARLRPGFRACYKRALSDVPDAAGSLRLTLQVGPGGEVDGVGVSPSGKLPPALVSCVVARARSASFEPPSLGRAVVVVPVTFVLQR